MYLFMFLLVFAVIFAFMWVAISSRGRSYGYGESYELDPVISVENFRPSDQRIREEIFDRLIGHAEVDAREIQVDVQRGEVNLLGKVPSKRGRHMVEELAKGVGGVYHVKNNLVVESHSVNAKIA